MLGLGGTIVVAVTATLAAIGAASIPSAGLVTMLMVLQASHHLPCHIQNLTSGPPAKVRTIYALCKEHTCLPIMHSGTLGTQLQKCVHL